MFYTYSQNNSGGVFHINNVVGHYVIIEAEAPEGADKKAEEIGIYFNGCDDERDCPCCGDRWYKQWDSGEDVPMIYGDTIDKYVPNMGDEHIHIYYADGKHEHVVVNKKKKEAKRIEEQRKNKENLFAVRVVFGNKFVTEVVEVFKKEGYTFLSSENGNFCVNQNKPGLHIENSIYADFLSKDKEAAEKFKQEMVRLFKALKEAEEKAAFAWAENSSMAKTNKNKIVIHFKKMNS